MTLTFHCGRKLSQAAYFYHLQMHAAILLNNCLSIMFQNSINKHPLQISRLVLGAVHLLICCRACQLSH